MLNLNSGASSSSSSLISFSILKRDENSTTHPLPEDSLRRRNFPAEQNAAGNEWLNLSSCSNINWDYHKEAEILNRNSVKRKKSRRGPKPRSSPYKGVTFYRRTGRWESHIWDCWKQIYLGGFDTAEFAARAYDRAAIRFRGVDADINFEASDYVDDIRKLRYLSKEEFVKVLRRESTGGNFSGWIPGEEQNLELSLGVSCCGSKKQELSLLNKLKHTKPDSAAGKASSTGSAERSWISRDENNSNIMSDIAASSGFSSSSALISFTGLVRYDTSQ